MVLQAVFLDRDGTINEDSGYVSKAEDFHLLPHVVDGLKLMHAAGAKLFIVTNQSGIARGFFSELQYMQLTKHMLATLSDAGVEIDDVRHCPHHPDITGACRCRKPQSGMILELLKQWGLDAANCWMVGDKETDVEAGKMVGLRCLLISGDDAAETKADFVANSLYEAAKKMVTVS